jgi:hypothetical protein
MNHQLYIAQRLAAARGQELQEQAVRRRTGRLARQAGSPTIHSHVKEDRHERARTGLYVPA